MIKLESLDEREALALGALAILTFARNIGVETTAQLHDAKPVTLVNDAFDTADAYLARVAHDRAKGKAK